MAGTLRASAKIERRNFFCISASEYAGVNLMPFFDAWGIKYSFNAQIDMEKLPNYGGREKFWEVWDVNKIPSFETSIPVKIDSYSYGMETGELNRKDWLAEHIYHNHPTEGNIANLFDGDANTHWNTGSVNRPILDVYPYFEVNMQSVSSVNYIIWQHRNFYYNRLLCKRFRLEYKENKEDNWTSLGEFTTTVDKTSQKFAFSNNIKVRMSLFKVILLEGHHEGGNTRGALGVAEFKLGYSE